MRLDIYYCVYVFFREIHNGITQNPYGTSFLNDTDLRSYRLRWR